MSRIFWDTNLFIYLLEDYKELSERTATVAQRMRARGDLLYTSTFTLGETLVKPLEDGNHTLMRRFEDVITRWASLISFNAEVARLYAGIRSDRSIKAPDAIQLACAAYEKVDLFITNDDRLERKTIPGVQFIVSLKRAFL